MEPLDGENERVTRQGRRARHAVQRKRYKHPLRANSRNSPARFFAVWLRSITSAGEHQRQLRQQHTLPELDVLSAPPGAVIPGCCVE